MNQTELNKYKAMLEAKQAELSVGSATGKTSPSKRPRMPWMKCSLRESGNWLSATWTANPTCCAM